jgi:2'-5' RNA ligase
MTSFILSLKLDDVSFERLQAWRTRHFPPALNHLPAHLTLLHTASREQISRLRERWQGFELLTPPRLTFAAPRYLRRGVAIDVESPGLRSLRSRMIEVMAGDLTRQDQQPFRAHVTVQNKVDAAKANALFESLRSDFEA